MKLRRMFDTEREGFRDWARYLTCRVVGHKLKHQDGHSEWWCGRCGDVMPQGNRRWQP